MQIGTMYTLETSRQEVAGKILELANLAPSSISAALVKDGSCYIRTMTFGDDDESAKRLYGVVGDLEKLGAAIVKRHDGKRTYGLDIILTPLGKDSLKDACEFALLEV